MAFPTMLTLYPYEVADIFSRTCLILVGEVETTVMSMGKYKDVA